MKPFLEFFGAAFLINLPERTDRLTAARAELARIGSNIAPGEVSLYAAKRFTDAAGFSSPGVRGCFDSHLTCLRQAASGCSHGVLMIEDDITLTSAMPRLAPAIVEYLSTHPWDLLFLGHEDTGELPRAKARTVASELEFRHYEGDFTCAHFYAVNGKTLPRLIGFLEELLVRPPGSPDGGPMPIDGGLNFFRMKNPDIVTVLVVPKLGWQRPSRSDLTPHWIDSVRWARGMVGGLRRIKQLTQRWRA